MRHRMKKNRLNMQSDNKAALIRGLATSVILYEKVTTTAKRATLAAPVVEKLIGVAKAKTASLAIREINKVVHDENACKKLIEVLKDRYKEKTSGYTRTTKFKNRIGDNAPLVVLELV